MAPAAPPGKPRCWVSEGVGCLKVQRERGPGFPRPPEGEIFETDMHPQMEAVTQTCIHRARAFTREMAIFEEQYLSNPSDNLQADLCV